MSRAKEKPYERVINVYVRHLPAGAFSPERLPSLYVQEFNDTIPIDTWIMLGAKHLAYENGDALAPLEAFVIAHDAGLYPPIWALDALAVGFRTYHQQQGKTPLDNLLKLNRGRGKSWFRSSAQQELHCQLAVQLYWIRTAFGVSVNVDEAAAMLEEKLTQSPIINNTRWKDLKIQYKAETLRREYPIWKRMFHLREDNIENPLHPEFAPWSQEQRRTFLLTFPEHSWPDSLSSLPLLEKVR